MMTALPGGPRAFTTGANLHGYDARRRPGSIRLFYRDEEYDAIFLDLLFTPSTRTAIPDTKVADLTYPVW